MADPSLRKRRQPPEEKSLESMSGVSDSTSIERHSISTGKRTFQQDSSYAYTLAFIIVVLAGCLVSFYKIWYPAEVVFDEVHFGKFAGYYLKRTYFFDVHPPLAKLMIAAVGYCVGYDGHFEFENIGDNYIENNVPYIALRALPASLNVMNIALMYSIMKASGYSLCTCIVTASMYILDNAMVAQHRLIMLDSMLIFFMLSTVYSYIRFRRVRHQEFSNEWWAWLLATGVTMALTLSVKMVGLFVVTAIGICVLIDLWDLLNVDRGTTLDHFLNHFAARAVAFIAVPILVFLFWFHVHFTILVESGPGDAFMSTSFQETLRNSAIKMKSLDIHYYDDITLMHKDTEMYLHSHSLRYPLRYEDGRISSQGQQVTAIKMPDENTWWKVKPTKPIVDGERVAVVHGDIVQLVHVNTGTHLLAHDVASPILSTNEEITTVPLDARYNETLFEVLLDDYNNGNVWQTHMKSVRLMHVDTKVCIWTHSQSLPEWGLGQQDVNGNKQLTEKSNYWVSTEIYGINATVVNLEKKKNIKSIPFLFKFVELFGLMLSHNSGLTKSHPYQSAASAWPLLPRGISYWSKDSTKEQIYMTGNVFGWWTSIVGTSVFLSLLIVDLVTQRRRYFLISEPARSRLLSSGGFFFILWALHYFPFFFMGRALFLHHYLPAATCNYLLLGSVFQFLFVRGVDSPTSDLQRNESAQELKRLHEVSFSRSHSTLLTYTATAVIIGLQLGFFIFLSPLTYGTPGLTIEQVLQHKLRPAWDLQFAK
ncbi:glycosyltransferase family 39 protein [Spinellus fusiger]|nr:glycosyltransferase family 39 protein [Spinellus fusiger]